MERGTFLQMDKQHLHIKSFYGAPENAVYTQIWIAVCAFLLLVIAKKRMHIEEPSLYMISQTIATMLFEKIPIPKLFYNQLITSLRMIVNSIYFETSNLNGAAVCNHYKKYYAQLLSINECIITIFL